MAKPKNLEQLRAEKEQVEIQLAQEQHKLNRLENRKKYLILWSGEENSRLASEHNLKLVTTNFTGRKPDEIYADFVFTDDGKYLIKCKNNCVPEDCIYDPGNDRSIAYFRISDCEGCPYKERCQPRFLKTRVRRKYLGNPLVVQNNYSTCKRKNFLNMQNLEME